MPVIKTKPVIEQIAEILFARLKPLTHGYSGSTQFSLKYANVVRPKRLDQDWTPEHLLICLTNGEAEPGDMKPGNPPSVEVFQTFNVDCFVMPSEQDATAVDAYKNTAPADIVQAVTIDGAASWHNFNNADGSPLALNTKYGPAESLPADGGADGVRMPFVVQYRTSELSPFVVRT